MPLLSDRPYEPIEFVIPTAGDLLIVVAIGYGLAFLVFAAGMLVFLPEALAWWAAERATASGTDVESAESAETVELPRRSGPRTGTVCDPRWAVDPDEHTRVLDLRAHR